MNKGDAASKVINLNRRRLGNFHGCAYAGALLKTALQQGVQVEELHLTENCLTTRGIVAIAATIHTCPQLRVLDVSMDSYVP